MLVLYAVNFLPVCVPKSRKIVLFHFSAARRQNGSSAGYAWCMGRVRTGVINLCRGAVMICLRRGQTVDHDRQWKALADHTQVQPLRLGCCLWRPRRRRQQTASVRRSEAVNWSPNPSADKKHATRRASWQLGDQPWVGQWMGGGERTPTPHRPARLRHASWRHHARNGALRDVAIDVQDICCMLSRIYLHRTDADN